MLSKRTSRFFYIFNLEWERMLELLQNKQLLDTDFLVYSLLCKMANEENDSCWPSKQYIANKLNKNEDTIRLSINRLCKFNLIQKVNREKTGTIISNLYFITDLEDALKQCTPVERGTPVEQVTNNINSIYTDNTTINHNIDNTNNAQCTMDNAHMSEEDFSVFWNSYPKRRQEDKQLTKFRFLKLKKELLPKILEALEKRKQTAEWKKDGGQFAPQPAKWLKGMRWEDEVEPMSMLEIAQQMKDEAAAKYGQDKAANIASFEFEKKYGQAEYLKLRDGIFEGE